MRTPIRPTLRDLQIGDKFYPASQFIFKKKDVFEVIGQPVFNDVYGFSLRKCKHVETGEIKEIACIVEVIKLFYCIECGAKVPDGEKYCNECIIVE